MAETLTVRGLLEGIAADRDKIAKVFREDMQIEGVSDNAKLAELATVAESITIDNDATSTFNIGYNADKSKRIEGGTYFVHGTEVSYIPDRQYESDGATPVYASENADSEYEADHATLIEKFVVKKIPIAPSQYTTLYANQYVSTEDDGGDNTFTLEAPYLVVDGEAASDEQGNPVKRLHYLKTVEIPKVMLHTGHVVDDADLYTVPADGVFEQDDYVVTLTGEGISSESSEWEWSGFKSLSIPRPTYNQQIVEVNILDDESASTANYNHDLDPGFIKESYVSVNTNELYTELAAI